MIKQSQSQKQTLKILPQQIQFLNFLQLSSLELEDHIRNEMEENPALEEGSQNDDPVENSIENEETNADVEILEEYYDWETMDNNEIPDYKTKTDNYSDDDEFYSTPMVQTKSFREELSEQIHWLSLPERQLALAEYLIYSLDEDGFLHIELEDIADDLSFAHSLFVSTEEIESALSIIRQLDPPGIGSRSLKECLLLQLEHKIKNEENYTLEEVMELELTCEVIESHIHELSNKNYDKIMKEMNISSGKLKKVLENISKLNPKPVAEETTSQPFIQTIYPDFILHYNEDSIEISLNGKTPDLHLNSSLIAATEKDSKNKSTAQFAKNKIMSAKWLIDAIKQRESTMFITMKTIVKMQKEYFISGDIKKLKPMILKDVADFIKMDISTISRVTSNKYAQTPFGMVHLKDLFSEGMMNNNGEEISNREIQQTIAEVVDSEDKLQPLSDQQIATLLSVKGYTIARRTVAKYRENLNIPVSQMRKELVY